MSILRRIGKRHAQKISKSAIGSTWLHREPLSMDISELKFSCLHLVIKYLNDDTPKLHLKRPQSSKHSSVNNFAYNSTNKYVQVYPFARCSFAYDNVRLCRELSTSDPIGASRPPTWFPYCRRRDLQLLQAQQYYCHRRIRSG